MPKRQRPEAGGAGARAASDAGVVAPGERFLPSPGAMTLDDIRHVLIDEGYAVGPRQAWLKEALTALEQHPSAEARQLEADVRRFLALASTPIREGG
jgi:hypothetical protein